jgi:hypothetical protein
VAALGDNLVTNISLGPDTPNILQNNQNVNLLGQLCGLLACQGTSTAEKQGEQTANPVGASTTAASMESPTIPAPQKGSAGLTGQVVAESDVSGQSDKSLPSQMVLAIPVEKAVEILGAGTQQLRDEELRFLKAALPQADPAITVSLSDAAGNYTLLLDPGEYVLCVEVSSGFGEIVLVES